jgi:hypothetical protein
MVDWIEHRERCRASTLAFIQYFGKFPGLPVKVFWEDVPEAKLEFSELKDELRVYVPQGSDIYVALTRAKQMVEKELK